MVEALVNDCDASPIHKVSLEPDMKSLFPALGLTVALFVGAVAPAAEHTKDSVALVREKLKKKQAVLVDVREPAEWKEGHLAAAISVPLSGLKKSADTEALLKTLKQQIPKDRIVYTHCASGQRCKLAADIMQKLGYDVRPLKAGYEDLLEAGFTQAKPEE